MSSYFTKEKLHKSAVDSDDDNEDIIDKEEAEEEEAEEEEEEEDEEEDEDEEAEADVDADAEEDVDDEVDDEVDADLQEDEDESDDEQEGGGPDSDLEEGEIDEEGVVEGEAEAEDKVIGKKSKKIKKVPSKNIYKKPVDFIEDDEEDDYDGEQYLQKFNQSVNDNYILNYHPESVLQNYDEILSMTKVVRNSEGIIVDRLHRTIPYLTKYEKARILGQRAKQINSGAYPFVKVPENVIDGYIIAEMELKEKRIPFIIRRPIPNGGSEYWKVYDLEDISF
jgi:DNA-directed RNA polymerase subunit K/omega